jgi:prepilin signal peptidase PulO-like enzyme (type II secretory pathway)
MEIPMIVIWIGIIMAIIFNLIIDLGNGFSGENFLEIQSLSGLVAAFLAWVFFFSLAYGSKEKWMGMGDSYLAIFLGLLLGLENVFYALVIGFLLGAFLGISLVLNKKKDMKSQLPLAPFLVLGTLIIIFWGKAIIHWHLGLFY